MALKLAAKNSTRDLRAYLLSDEVTFDSEEFIPKAAVVDLLVTTPQTIIQRIREGVLSEKTFFILDPKKKTWSGLKAGGVKKLLVQKEERKNKIIQHVEDTVLKGEWTNYSHTMEIAGMDWQSPPDRKFINEILDQINHESFAETIDAGQPCLKGAVVVSINEGIPTNAFYDCALELGIIEPSDISDKHQKREFWESQFKLVKEIYTNARD